jgi:hypothetical protein
LLTNGTQARYRLDRRPIRRTPRVSSDNLIRRETSLHGDVPVGHTPLLREVLAQRRGRRSPTMINTRTLTTRRHTLARPLSPAAIAGPVLAPRAG